MTNLTKREGGKKEAWVSSRAETKGQAFGLQIQCTLVAPLANPINNS